MSSITTRISKGSALSHSELDQNFLNLNADKYQSGDSPSFNNLTITGNLTVTGTTTTVNATNLEISDPLIYLATGNSGNVNDIGVVGHFNPGGFYQHTGLVRDATDNKWRLFSGVATEPSSTIDFSSWVKDTLQLGQVDATSLLLNGATSGTTLLQASATASGTLTLPATTDTLIGRATTDTLTNKTLSLANNTLTTTLAQLNTAITDADVAATTHKYHEFTVGSYYYDNYQQSRYLRIFTENAAFDNARFAAITNVEYHDGTNWVAWVGGEASVRNLLDGRQNTYIELDHAHRRFRFTINKNSGWPTDCLIGMYMSWYGNAWTNVLLTIEDTADQVSWTTKNTLTFGAGTTNSDYGWHAYQSGSLHNGRTLNRITFEIDDWVDQPGYTTKRINSFSIFSNYDGLNGSNGIPVSWDYSKQIYTLSGLTTANDASSTLTIGRFSSSDQTSYLDTTTSATAMFLRVNYYPVIRLVRRDSVNYTQFTGGISGEAVTIAANGSDTNVGMIVQSKGTGEINFWTGATAASQVRIIDNAGADRPLTLAGGKSGNTGARIGVANEALDIYTSGGYAIFFSTNGMRSATQFIVNNTASAVNYVSVTGATTGGSPVISAQGSDTNISLQLNGKGTGGVKTQYYHQIGTSYANYVSITGNTTGAAPSISAGGTDSDIILKLISKGTGSIDFSVPTAVGTLVGDTRTVTNTYSSAGNVLVLRNWLYRHTAGSDWTGVSSRLGHVVDVTAMSYIEFNPVGQDQGMALFVANAKPLQIKTTGGEQLRVANVSNAVNYVQITGSATANNVSIGSQGSDANVAIGIYAKGDATAFMVSNNATTFEAYGPTSAVNRIRATSSITGSAVSLSAIGTDTNVGVDLFSKGTGAIRLRTGGGIQLYVQDTASAVNYVQVSGAATGNTAVLSFTGSDTNVNGNITTKGTGILYLTSGGLGTVRLGNSGGEHLIINGAASSVNKFNLKGTITGQAPLFWVAGTDTNVGMDFSTKGTGAFRFYSNDSNGGTGALQLTIAHTASAVNFVQITGSATGSDPLISAQGSDSNKGLRYAAKGGGGAGHRFFGNSSATEEIVRFTSVNGGNAYVNITGGSTGLSPIISVEGSDTHIDLEAKSKGNGVFYVNAPAVKLKDAVSSPATTTMRLYSVNGKLHYNGAEVGVVDGATTYTAGVDYNNIGFEILYSTSTISMTKANWSNTAGLAELAALVSGDKLLIEAPGPSGTVTTTITMTSAWTDTGTAYTATASFPDELIDFYAYTVEAVAPADTAGTLQSIDSIALALILG